MLSVTAAVGVEKVRVVGAGILICGWWLCFVWCCVGLGWIEVD